VADRDADRRHPRQPFHPALFDEFVRGRAIVSVQELAGGRVNSSFVVDLDDGTRVVARQYARGSARNDAQLIALAASVVPVPDVVAWGDGWAVMRWVPGEKLQDRPPALRDAARCLARLSRITLDRPGQITPNGIEPWDFGPHRHVNEMFLADERVRTSLGVDLTGSVYDLLHRESDRLRVLESGAVLVHGDYNGTNILVEGEHVTGILDWEFAMSGSPYGDIGNLRRNFNGAFDAEIEAGLRDEGFQLPSDWQRLAELADLSSALEFLTGQWSEAFKQRCIEQVQRLVDNRG
jgi:aminoglycoside phosphotransferase (APT) family kinase protein